MDDIINYTMENPNNTNPNVLRGLLENYSEGGGSGNSDLMVLKITNADTPGEYTFSHTPAEVYSWVAANKPAIAIKDGVIGKVYLGHNATNSAVVCSIPEYNGFFSGFSGAVPNNDGLTAVGYKNGTEWEISLTQYIFGADEVLTGETAYDGYAIIWDGQDGAPYYQPINKYYTFNGALYQLVSGAMSVANPEAALSTVFESTAPEFDGLIYTIRRIYDTFVINGRGIIVQGIVDQDNRDSWLVKNVTGIGNTVYITVDACFTTFTNYSPSSVSMITLTIAGLENASQEPEKIAVTAICKTINTTVV